jgi:hypothetical protein
MKNQFEINVENKAKELWDKFYLKHQSYDDEKYGWIVASINNELSKRIIIDVIDEIINANKECAYTIDYTNTSHAMELDAKVRAEISLFVLFWNEVKKEIKNNYGNNN